MPEIVESDGDIFASGCEALVNPVDCTVAQGAGLAKLFALRFPRQCRWYRGHAQRGFAEPGQPYFVLPLRVDDRLAAARNILDAHRRCGEEPALVLFATTKAHWRRPSELRWIRLICNALVDVAQELELRSLAVPALGCGEGGLLWSEVRPLILAAAERMPCERVVVYGPKPAGPRRKR